MNRRFQEKKVYVQYIRLEGKCLVGICFSPHRNIPSEPCPRSIRSALRDLCRGTAPYSTTPRHIWSKPSEAAFVQPFKQTSSRRISIVILYAKREYPEGPFCRRLLNSRKLKFVRFPCFPRSIPVVCPYVRLKYSVYIDALIQNRMALGSWSLHPELMS